VKQCVIKIEDSDWVDVLTRCGLEGITPGEYLMRGVHSPVVRLDERLDRIESKLVLKIWLVLVVLLDLLEERH
jgi:hypothetical protein